MNVSARALPWIIAGGALFFLGVLAYGLYQGELVVPSKGFRTTLERATNPTAFYAAAVFYAVLAGACAWLLVAVLRASDSGRPRARSGAPSAPPSGGAFPGRIGFTQDGRSGHVNVALASGTHAFYWEFGGGACVAYVSVPTAEEWPRVPALAPHPRAAFLDALAREVGRQQCPRARYAIERNAIVYSE